MLFQETNPKYLALLAYSNRQKIHELSHSAAEWLLGSCVKCDNSVNFNSHRFKPNIESIKT